MLLCFIPFLIAARPFSRNLTFKIADKLARKYKFDESEYVGIPGWEQNVLEPRKYFEELVYLDFEDFKVPAPAAYDELLTHWYGDYMKRPPENKRQPHHNYKAYKL